MQRYFVEENDWQEELIELSGDDAHHIVKVMRMKVGSQFIVANGQGKSALAELYEINSGAVTAKRIEWLPMELPFPVKVTIAQGLPKGDKMEMVIQKGTEIGAACFLPFESERMIVQYDAKKEAKRLERWRKIAKEAAEQAHRTYLPEVKSVHRFAALLEQMQHYDVVLLCYEQQAKQSEQYGLATALATWRATSKYAELKTEQQPSNILVIIGPEGGFSDQEAAEAIAAGAVAISLGSNILRTETAGIVALSCILYDAGVMGGVS
ncbi:16S rRNA (uracil(1498)-N(3))-methyltransferase [Paenibacillus yanchengensis]|uniref:Ribosomal RNA small subunit methyltransferase E n=1 Tax=Paenibacillus yanchengensis TaxID=2035833 RepID=A0ABW4YK88_9BACL